MNRRLLLKSLAVGPVAAFGAAPRVYAAVPKMKIVRVRVYEPPNPNPLFNQSDRVVLVDTDAGVTGIGEGGSKDTLEQSAGRLIGQDPQYIERLWQDMSRSFFYPPGREKMDAIGALDLALWDIKGKVHGMPVHALLGGMARNYCECYNTAGIIPGIQPGMSVKERARLTIAAGISRLSYGRGGCAGEYDVQHARAPEQVVRRMRRGARRGGQERRLVRRFSSALRFIGCDARLRFD